MARKRYKIKVPESTHWYFIIIVKKTLHSLLKNSLESHSNAENHIVSYMKEPYFCKHTSHHQATSHRALVNKFCYTIVFIKYFLHLDNSHIAVQLTRPRSHTPTVMGHRKQQSHQATKERNLTTAAAVQNSMLSQET